MLKCTTWATIFWGIPAPSYPASRWVFLENKTEAFRPCLYIPVCLTGLPHGSDGKASNFNARDRGWSLLEKGNGNPLQYFCLDSHMDRWGWWAMVHGVAKIRTSLRDKRCHLSTWVLMSLLSPQVSGKSQSRCMESPKHTWAVTSGFLEQHFFQTHTPMYVTNDSGTWLWIQGS